MRCFLISCNLICLPKSNFTDEQAFGSIFMFTNIFTFITIICILCKVQSPPMYTFSRIWFIKTILDYLLSCFNIPTAMEHQVNVSNSLFFSQEFAFYLRVDNLLNFINLGLFHRFKELLRNFIEKHRALIYINHFNVVFVILFHNFLITLRIMIFK